VTSVHQKVVLELAAKRRATLSRIGDVSPDVLSRLLPIVPTAGGPRMRAWPSSVLGKLLIVRRERTVLVLTDGLSDPFDPEMHPDAVGTFGFEMAVEVPTAALGDASDQAIASSWIPALLWAATDWMMMEHVDVKGRLIDNDCLTHAILPVVGLERFIARNGVMGGLLGIPFVGDSLCAQAVLAPEANNPADAIWLLPIKLLTVDEYEWAMGVSDNARVRTLAEAFLRKDRHLTWLERPSVLREIGA
jgi:hypothetical protein